MCVKERQKSIDDVVIVDTVFEFILNIQLVCENFELHQTTAVL